MAGPDHSTRDHALLSASGASRWINCTPSARLEEKSPEPRSVYAEEGTLAHELADLKLQRAFKGLHGRTYNAEVRKIKTRLLKLLDSKDETLFDEMESEVDKYVAIVDEAFKEAQARTPDATLILEQRLDFSHIVPDGFGTGDVVIIADELMEVIDLKYGKGVEVNAKLNPQFMLYGLGALRDAELLYDVERVRMTAVQPRLDNYSTWETSINYLHGWAEKIAKPAASKAYAGEGEKKAGDWCKFCKVKAVCRAVADQNLELARHDFRDPHLLSLDELAPIYKQAFMLQDWISAVESHLVEAALSGKTVIGFKLVEGRSNRRWANEEQAIEVLKELGHPKDKVVNEKIKGIGEIERLVGKDKFNSLMGGVVVKPAGKPTLVDAADPRPAMGLAQAQQDFKEPI